MDCPAGAVYYSASRVTHPELPDQLGEPPMVVFYDALQRELQSRTYGLDGTEIKQDTDYDSAGRVSAVSEPYTDTRGESTQYSNYNALGEAQRVDQPQGGYRTLAYTLENGWLRQTQTRTIVDSASTAEQVTHRFLDPLGQLRRTIDDHGIATDFEYDVLGKVSSTLVNANAASKVTVSHDVAGNKTALQDPATGPIHFAYNGFGELRVQTWRPDTPQAKSITYAYDGLGRQTSRTDVSAAGASTQFAWTYDTLKQGYLTRATGNGVTEDFSYNALAQVKDRSITQAGLAAKRFTYTYDAFGRLDTQSFPNGLAIRQQYQASGVHARTTNVSIPAAPKVVWALGEVLDARGDYQYIWFGNSAATGYERDPRSGLLTGITTGKVGGQLAGLKGDIQHLAYTWDSLGNLQGRSSRRTNSVGAAVENLSESFGYDGLNRLVSATTHNGGLLPVSVSYGYDAYGNLKHNRLGALAYQQTNGASLYGVTSVGGDAYHYDAYGNVSRLGSRTAEYDVFNKPVRIGNTSFTYGPGHEKVKTVSGTQTLYHFA
ncbi:MAG TPA: hypothetical protein VLF15_01655, partial [Pseudoxanthomonas sp.]|nr:hypothetical protein [Pseudoxanthomonas sp.]